MEKIISFLSGNNIPKTKIYYQFFTSSSIIFLSTVGVNLFNYLFHLGSARLLSVESYGILQTILNLLGLTTILTVIIRLQITKELIQLIVDKKFSRAGSLIKKLSAHLFCIMLILFTLFFIFEYLFDINFGLLLPQHIATLLLLTGLTYYLSLYRSMMHAYLMFGSIAINTNLQALLRLTIAVLLLLLGFKLVGVLIALVISYCIPLFASLIQLKDKLTGNLSEKVGINKRSFSIKSLHTMIGQLALTSLISTDLILVQYFLPNQAGLYAGLGLFGKAVLFTTTPLSTVLFPMIISSSKKDGARIFIISATAIAIIGALAVIIFNMFAESLVKLLLSPSYLAISESLGLYITFIAVYCISNLIISGFIALNKYQLSYIALIATCIQIIGITLFHKDLHQIIYVCLITTFSLTTVCVASLLNFYRSKTSSAGSHIT